MAAILECMPAQPANPDGDFAWPPTVDPLTWTAFRTSDAEATRPIEHVALREIGNAMVSLCSAYAGMEEEELLRDTLALFGGRRLTSSALARLQSALTLTLEQKRIERAGPTGLLTARA